MLTLKEVQKGLADRNLKKVSRAVDLCYLTVWRVANEKAESVSYETIKKLSDYLEGKDETST